MTTRYFALPERKQPTKDRPGVYDGYSIQFVTVCTKHRGQFLANDTVHRLLIDMWSDTSQWRVGRYVIMPDHVHLFARESTRYTRGIRAWAGWWKRRVSVALGYKQATLWQSVIWDTRVYSSESYQQKVDYVMKNPVRADLVIEPQLWPYQGMIHQVGWFD